MIETIKTSSYTIKQILQDNWDEFYKRHKRLIRPVVIANVKKVMACGDKDILGYNTYVCPECRKKVFVCKLSFFVCGLVLIQICKSTAQKIYWLRVANDV